MTPVQISPELNQFFIEHNMKKAVADPSKIDNSYVCLTTIIIVVHQLGQIDDEVRAALGIDTVYKSK